jgi:hypothetical protein
MIRTTLRVIHGSQLALQRVWDDQGTRTRYPLTIYRVNPAIVLPDGCYPIGDLAVRGYGTLGAGVTGIVIKEEAVPTDGLGSVAMGDVSEVDVALLAAPETYERVWDSSRSPHCQTKPLFIWKPIAPRGLLPRGCSNSNSSTLTLMIRIGYVSLGYVTTLTPDLPSVDAVRCVHRDVVVNAQVITTNGYCLWSSNLRFFSSLKTLIGRPTPNPIALWHVGRDDSTILGSDGGDEETHHGFIAEQTDQWTAEHVQQPINCLSRFRIAHTVGQTTAAALTADAAKWRQQFQHVLSADD